MVRHNLATRMTVESLRKSGHTYGEIFQLMKKSVSKSTISQWCRQIQIEPKALLEKTKRVEKKLTLARLVASKVAIEKRQRKHEQLDLINEPLLESLKNFAVKKLLLASLYWCEGGKNGSALCFGNSSPEVIRLFLKLLRCCYQVDESKFRCTLQLRGDQNVEQLQQFWSIVTGITVSQFYSARVDSRTVGKVSRKLEYKGVCRIDYFSAEIYHDIQSIIRILGR